MIRFCGVLLVAILCTQHLHAQILYGSLVGNGVDPSSAVVPGATVTLKSSGTGRPASRGTRSALPLPGAAWNWDSA